MSEYQHYYFLALDRTLSQAQRDELRKISSRATITSTSLENVYHFGDFKADPIKLLAQKYFDVFVYNSNFNYRRFAVRLPLDAISPQALAFKLDEDHLRVHRINGSLILEFIYSREDAGDYMWDSPEHFEEQQGWGQQLVPLRASLASGDLSPLYLAWLAQVEHQGGCPSQPALPAQLDAQDPKLLVLARFLDLDERLLQLAASYQKPSPANQDALRAAWLSDQPNTLKDETLLAMMANPSDMAPLMKLLRRFAQEQLEPTATIAPTADELLGQLKAQIAQENQRVQQAARARQQRIDALDEALKDASVASSHQALWRAVEALANKGNTTAYAKAAELIEQLQTVAKRLGSMELVEPMLSGFISRHSGKSALKKALRAKGLMS